MPCFSIQWESSFGTHESRKWGDDAADALRALKRQHGSLGAPYRGALYGKVELLNPQPFTPEARALTDQLHGRVAVGADAPGAPAVEIFFGEEEDLDFLSENDAAAA
jgi:hypothetical protein